MRKTTFLASVLSIVLLFGALTPRAAAQGGYYNNGYGGYSYYQPNGPYNSPFGYQYQPNGPYNSPFGQYRPNSGYSNQPSNTPGNYQPNFYQPNFYQPYRYQPNFYQPYRYGGG